MGLQNGGCVQEIEEMEWVDRREVMVVGVVMESSHEAKINSLSPKRLFCSKKDRSAISRSDPSSFGSGTTSSNSLHKLVPVDGDSAFLAIGGLAGLGSSRVWLAGDTVFGKFQILHLILFGIPVHQVDRDGIDMGSALRAVLGR
uniref:uncharacterized protein LOC105350837 n=1 Tax=Fragaria vesca subsp. vesca TaxID=101020 RepID=UPI0005C7FB8E|nr:PREDICTED: uncharacterized protein LOC105350837 [Fragaria vesca subsp. vesca]